MQVDFYHLTRTPVEAVLPRLIEKILAGGNKALLVARDGDLLNRLDEHLWRHEPASFLPHGLAGKGDEAVQPVLLSQRAEPLNDAGFLLIADGEWPEEDVSRFERIFYLFDQNGIDVARQRWRQITSARRYWKQDDNGRWVEGP